MRPACIPPSVYGEEKVHPLSDIVQNAVMFQYDAFDETSVGQSVTYTINAMHYQSWVKQVASFFRMYRARIRITLMFFCSPLISGRFSVHYSPIPANSGADACKPMETFEVKGSVTKVIEVPYVAGVPIYFADDPQGELILKCDAAPRGLTSGNQCAIDVFAFISMAPGAQFFSQRMPPLGAYSDPTPPPPEALEGQSALREIARGEPDICWGPPGEITPISYYDETYSVEDTLTRWCDINLPIAGIYPPLFELNPYPYTTTPIVYRGKYNAWGDFTMQWAPCFTLWRGSKEFRVRDTNNAAGTDIVATMSNGKVSSGNGLTVGHGAFLTTKTDDSMVQLRVPYLNKYMFSDATEEGSLTLPIPTNSNAAITSATVKYLGRAGPDYQLIHLNRLFPGAASAYTFDATP